MTRPISLLALVLASSPVWAQFDAPMRQHEAHVHGEAVGNLSLDGGDLRLTLDIPAYNLIGFEHPPSDAAQQGLLNEAVEVLESLAWLTPESAADCARRTVEIETPGLVASNDDHDHDHDHEHEHEHEHADHHDTDDHGHDHGHGAFEVRVELHCRRPDELRWIDIDLFTGYANNARIRLDVLTEQTVDQVDLGPDRVRVELQ